MYPDFLCIGAQKAGTSWLYKNLNTHPQIWLPPRKEIHYFDLLYEDKPNLLQRMQKPDWRRWVNRSVRHHLRNFVTDVSSGYLLWDLRFLFSRTIDDNWYASLFESGVGKTTGDITPAYSTLDAKVVEHVHALIPHAKVIFLLRNPIDRAWSHAVMSFEKRRPVFTSVKKRFDDLTDEDYIRHFNSQSAQLRGNYVRTLNIWRKHYPKKQFFVAFLEDIARRPEELLVELYTFLEVDPSLEYVPKFVRTKIHARGTYQIPARLGATLAKMYYGQIEQLIAMFSDYQMENGH